MLLVSVVIAVSIRHTRHGPQARLRGTLFAPPQNPSTPPASSAHTAKSTHTPTKRHWDPRAEQPVCTLCYVVIASLNGDASWKYMKPFAASFYSRRQIADRHIVGHSSETMSRLQALG